MEDLWRQGEGGCTYYFPSASPAVVVEYHEKYLYSIEVEYQTLFPRI